MRRKNSSHSGDIEDLKRQNQILEGQIKALEKAKSSGHFGSAASVLHTAHSLGGSEVGEGGGARGGSPQSGDGGPARKKPKS